MKPAPRSGNRLPKSGAPTPGGASSRGDALPLLAAGTATALAGGVVAHLLPGVVAWRSMRYRLLPQLAGVGDPGHVALTFDDGPDPKSTPPILDALDTLGWHATFFCLGSQVRRSPDLTRELVRRGHEVAVHGDSHRSHLRRPFTSTVPDLRRARATIEDVAGVRVRWFRPPYGAVSTATLVAIRKSGLQMVLWTTWGLDWQPRATGRTVAANVARTFRPGATVLLHDSDITSIPGTWRSALSALPILGRQWAAAGLQVGTLGEHNVVGPGATDGLAGCQPPAAGSDAPGRRPGQPS
jgi:peptidoglycan/xylan/chitin deacetylase (PgdA/CDA1 family)